MEFRIRAYHIGKRLDLTHVDSLFSLRAAKSDPTYRLIVPNENTFYYFKDFGAVITINATQVERDEVLSKLGANTDTFEEFTLHVDPSESLRADFNTIWIPELNLDLLHIICLNIAQSLALDQYQKEVDILLEKTRVITTQLEKLGKINNSQRKLARFSGEIMNLRNRMADNLYIFETPPLAWKDLQLSEMDEILNLELDFGNRHRAIQHSLLVVKDNHEFFNNLLQHKHSSLLEWIIIILILFEVIHIFIK